MISKGITRKAALIITDVINNDVRVSYFQEKNKWGGKITLYQNEKSHLELLSSNAIFSCLDNAVIGMKEIISAIKDKIMKDIRETWASPFIKNKKWK